MVTVLTEMQSAQIKWNRLKKKKGDNVVDNITETIEIQEDKWINE